ncbi:hypothetical protein MADA3029_1090051 [Vibrio nigripulchritudo MADA3029]|uniref:Uncharacterized protein n=2 Tax=Vibrio nigripulchritudo TaxID=28173 RepID=U4K151_9VIBR|nr:hypothetical protein VIBNIAM115_1870001 [Vibrio nigripulchritudo AM115]CCN40906.1 hypothetical protein VIBNIFTn2_1390102 [Vibrio nigripulchritudo FTn2]CCN46889.1 hypothetical protein VIBNIMADA3020_250001 [Vibrio nigripulchritudo MADA3020]CCN51695.1 hypothetical protein VIBNIMADA3021_1150050 [Vibrio nigripulchritudo MADA3021]CCN57301.1 hypothetical protein MADA3029_1090051 [Vibrio nigripulchritudo MADA3029]CCN67420.1 hypothetical protein VIBNIPon4_750104 [Vibrio nigripulchritudo POn4]CCN706
MDISRTRKTRMVRKINTTAMPVSIRTAASPSRLPILVMLLPFYVILTMLMLTFPQYGGHKWSRIIAIGKILSILFNNVTKILHKHATFLSTYYIQIRHISGISP